jgi:hypothetical protein
MIGNDMPYASLAVSHRSVNIIPTGARLLMMGVEVFFRSMYILPGLCCRFGISLLLYVRTRGR